MPQSELQRLVDILDGGHPLRQAVVHFVAQRRVDPVDQESRSVLDEYADLADPVGDLLDRPDRLVRCLEPADDLHQLHDGHGAEEMHAREPVRPIRCRRQLRDRNGRGVAGKKGMRRADLLQLPEQIQLRRLVLDDRLDDEFAIPGRGQLRRSDDPPQRRLFVRLGKLALGDAPAEVLLDGGHSLGDECMGNVPQQHVVSRPGHHLCDAGSHESGANHHDPFDLHVSSFSAVRVF